MRQSASRYRTVPIAGTLAPRACDCDFCQAHGAAYISDPDGRLAITIRDDGLTRRYRQGDAIADMLLCGRCGVLVGALFTDDAETFGTVNVGALDRTIPFGDRQAASPKLLDAENKIDRWKRLWFRNVTVRPLSRGDA